MALMRDVFPIKVTTAAARPARAAPRPHPGRARFGAGDRVVFTSGEHMETRGATNTLRLLQMGDDGKAGGLGELWEGRMGKKYARYLVVAFWQPR